MIDSSVWIAYFRGVENRQTDVLDVLLKRERLVVGDLILTEVLQGFKHERNFRQAAELLTSLSVVTLGGLEIALRTATNFRKLRKLGITVSKTIDAVIATKCIESDFDLLHDDRDFDPFAEHLGLRVV